MRRANRPWRSSWRDLAWPSSSKGRKTRKIKMRPDKPNPNSDLCSFIKRRTLKEE